MVYDMQRWNVLVLLAQNKEERVKELCEFWYVVPPTDINHLKWESEGFVYKLLQQICQVETYA